MKYLNHTSMDIRSHAAILNNSRWFILVVTVLVGVAALLFGLFQPLVYKGFTSFEVRSVTQPPTEEYQYGGYYEIKAAEVYTQHLMSLVRTPAVVEEIYQNAGQGYEIDNINRFTNRFQAKQYSARNFSVSFTDRNKETAERLAQAVAAVVELRATQTDSVGEESRFEVIALNPVVAPSQYNPWAVTVVGALAGLIFSVLLVYLREYFRPE